MNELIVVPDKKMPNLYRVKWTEGGNIPNFLDGLFSTRIAAKKRVIIYENKPKPKPIEYKGQKTISNEEEAELFDEVKKQVEAENNGKEKENKGKNKGGAESVREGTDNGSKPANVS